jgi:hypothetical protein
MLRISVKLYFGFEYVDQIKPRALFELKYTYN